MTASSIDHTPINLLQVPIGGTVAASLSFLERNRHHAKRLFTVGCTGKAVRISAGLRGGHYGVTLLIEEQGAQEVGGNVRGALWTMGENAGHIKQGLARLKKLDIG